MMYLELFGGLVYLLLGGDLLVRGSLALARRAAVPPLIVGLTVVAFGTSAPELCISLDPALTGHSSLAIGNVVGSNIANVLLVLGLPALIYPTLCDQKSLVRDTVFVLLASSVFTLFCFTGQLGRTHGAIMFGLLLLPLWVSAREAQGGSDEPVSDAEFERVLGLPTRPRMIALLLVLGGLCLPLGASLTVEGAVQVAGVLGVSSAVIGLSVVAVGTSLPELATTVVAAFHRTSDLALGNVLGSNLFNILAIMGLTALVAPSPLDVPPSFLGFDLLVMMAVTVVLAWFAWRRAAIGRVSGLVLLASYALYLVAVYGSSGVEL